MFEERVLPELRKHFGKGPVSVQRTFKFYGLAESAADRKLRPVYAAAGRKADCTILAGLGLVELRVSLRADSASSGKRALEKIERRVRTAMKEHMYGTDEDTLASALGNRLKKLGRTIAVAESCTGGMLGEQITEVAGSSAYFLGGVLAYCNRVKLRQLCVSPETLNVHGAVSAPCARELAVNAAGLLGADCALSITGIAGPGGGSEAKPVGTVFIGIFIKNRHSGRATSCVKELRCAGTRAQIRQRAVHAAMFQMLRRLPIIRNKKHR